MEGDLCLGVQVSVVERGEDGGGRPADRLGALYQEHGAALARYAFRRGVADSDIEDVIADVFVIAWRKLDSVPPAPGDRLWLLGVARNVVAKHQEGRWRRARVVARLAATAPISGGATPSEQVALGDAIGRLPSRDRDVVLLVLWEGLTHEEVAVVLGCSASASRLRLHRAKARLRTMVEADG